MFHVLILSIAPNYVDFIDSLWVFAVFLSDIDGNELGESQIIIDISRISEMLFAELILTMILDIS